MYFCQGCLWPPPHPAKGTTAAGKDKGKAEMPIAAAPAEGKVAIQAQQILFIGLVQPGLLVAPPEFNSSKSAATPLNDTGNSGFLAHVFLSQQTTPPKVW